MAASRDGLNVKQLVTSLAIILLFYSLEKTTQAQDDEWDEFLLCRQCGHEVTRAVDLKGVASNQALRQRNDTILGIPGVLIQLFTNPLGNKFELITAKKADVKKYNEVYPGDSWFPGYSWRIGVCPRCGQHLGWAYVPHEHKHIAEDTEETFYGLILDHLIHQDYADSLIAKMPKTYNS